MDAIFLSDVHLYDPEDTKTRVIIRFLKEVAAQYREIYILGDFFDSWPMTSSFLLDRFDNVLEALHELVLQGHSVYYFEGNHDFHLGDHFPEKLGITVYPNGTERSWDGKRIYIAHGDLGNPAEKGYRVLRKVLRSIPLKLTLRAIPGSFVHRAGDLASRTSRGRQDYESQYQSTRSAYREAVLGYFRQGYDVVMFGHTHIPEDYSVEVEGKICRYLNTGDWVRNFTYIVYERGEFHTRTHPISS